MNGTVGDRIVLVASDKRLLRQSLTSLIDAWTGFAALAAEPYPADRGRPEPVDTLLVDIGDGDDRGEATCGALRQQHSSASLALLVSRPGRWVESFRSRVGARTWVSHDAGAAELRRQLVRDGHNGAAPGSPGRVGMDALSSGPGALLLGQLTEREHRVLDCLVDGMSDNDIALRLGISSQTVRTHVQNLMSKLDVHSRGEAVAFVARARPCTLPSPQWRPYAPDAEIPMRRNGVTSALSVVLYHPQLLTRTALRTALDGRPGLRVATEAATGAEVLELARAGGPDVAVLAAASPEGDGIRACAAMKSRALPTRVLILGDRPDPLLLRAAVEAGADGYVTMDESVVEIEAAVRRVSDGTASVPPHMLGGHLRDLIRRRREEDGALHRFSRLSRRERKILSLLVKGFDMGAIADELTVSVATARTHVRNILRKLEVRSRMEAVALVREHALVERFALDEASE